MLPSQSAAQLLATSQAELEKLLVNFERDPSRAGFFDIGAVAEVLALSERIQAARSLTATLADAASRWLRSGLLEDAAFARVEFVYHTAVLCYLARHGKDYSGADMLTVKRLFEARLIGRSELPVVTQQVTGAYLSLCGVHADFTQQGQRDLVLMIDKRVLRTRSDEYDIAVLIMCAQLLQFGANPSQSRPLLFPQILLTQAIRSVNLNWLSVLAFLCAKVFGLPYWLRAAAVECILDHLPPKGDLLPWPKSNACDSKYIQRASRGLRLRSTIALALYFNDLGDFNHE